MFELKFLGIIIKHEEQLKRNKSKMLCRVGTIMTIQDPFSFNAKKKNRLSPRTVGNADLDTGSAQNRLLG